MTLKLANSQAIYISQYSSPEYHSFRLCCWWSLCVMIILFVVYIDPIKSDVKHNMFGNELKIANHVRRRVEHLTEGVAGVERKFNTLLALKYSQLNKEDYVTTAITALVMVRRLVQDWFSLTAVVKILSKPHQFDLGHVRWPSPIHLDAAARAVVRSQLTYSLSTDFLARGIHNNKVLTNVTVGDSFEIARQYFQKERFSEAREWLQHALAAVHETDAAPSRQTLLYYYAAALCFSGDTRTFVNFIRTILKETHMTELPASLVDYFSIISVRGCIYPDRTVLSYLDKRYLKSCNGYISTFRHIDGRHLHSRTDCGEINFYRNQTELENHSRLCRGEGRTDSRLVCRYTHYHLPYLRFQPFKLEELQLEPPVIRFHDLLSDTDAQAVIALAKHKMGVSKVNYAGRDYTTEERTSQVAWLDSSEVGWLDPRLRDVTRLDPRHAELYQACRYSVSGENRPHWDYFSPLKNWTDDRIATFMFYLNDVEEGGRTVFHSWNLSVAPMKNSAVLWFNYKPTGEVDDSTLHSGCPVLKGYKWVLNKWFRSGNKHVDLPCPLDKEGSYQEFYL